MFKVEDSVISSSFAKLGGLKITSEVSKEGIFTLVVQMISIVPPTFLKLAASKNITLMEYLRWAEKFSKKKLNEHLRTGQKKKAKIDQQVIQMIKTTYAAIGAVKAFASLYPKHKIREFLTPNNLLVKMKEWLPKAKTIDPEGYRAMMILYKLAQEYPNWYIKQINEIRKILTGE